MGHINVHIIVLLSIILGQFGGLNGRKIGKLNIKRQGCFNNQK